MPAISIASKYVLRVDGRHLWNPSNFGIIAMLFLAPDTVAGLSIQWGNNLLPMVVIWLLGSVIICGVGRLHITRPTSRRSSSSRVVRSSVTGHPFAGEVAPITGPMYQLFIFFMITDPKTTVRLDVGAVRSSCSSSPWSRRCFRLMQVVYAPFYALFIVGPIANLIEIALTTRSRAREGSPGLRPAPGHRERILRWLPRIFPWLPSIRF